VREPTASALGRRAARVDIMEEASDTDSDEQEDDR
jgi:hypothetical protein